jgi:hypothetical protein
MLKNIFFALITVRIERNNRKFVKDCFVFQWIVKIFYSAKQNGRQQQNERAILRCHSDV